jgi:hypothetical protein
MTASKQTHARGSGLTGKLTQRPEPTLGLELGLRAALRPGLLVHGLRLFRRTGRAH